MTLSIILGYAIASMFMSDPPSHDRIDPSPRALLFPESLHKEQLHRTRRAIATIEDNIELFERLMRIDGLYSPEGKERMQPRLAEWRAEVEKRRKVEQFLVWYEMQRMLRPGMKTDLSAAQALERLLDELWPPPAVAPQPREAKR